MHTRWCYLYLVLAFSFPFILTGQSYQDDISQFREQLNAQYVDSLKSPLKEKDRETFEGHLFFPINERFRIEADYIPIENGEPFGMKTTTDRLPIYKPYAKALFTFRDKTHELTLYQNVEYSTKPLYKDVLFLPFKDFTNGELSYGGGRFIDLKIPQSDKIIIDFNKSYNPYCAYNSKYSCPIPPRENHLQFEVDAGIMAPKMNH